MSVPERSLAPLLPPTHPSSRVVGSLWGKGFELEWAFEHGVILVVDEENMELGRSSNPSRDAVKFQERLTAGISSRQKPPEAPMLVMSNESLDLEFPCGLDRILVRDAYYEAYDQCMARLEGIGGNNRKKSAPGVLLTGNPGIGKSVFLSFCLVVRLLQALPSAYQGDRQDGVLLLTGEGCFDIYNSQTLTTMDEERKSVVALCDSLPVHQIMGGTCHRRWPILFASSPKEEDYKFFVKSKGPMILYMDLCSRQELRVLNLGREPRFSDAEFEDIFNRYHPTPRFLDNIDEQDKPTAEFLIQYDRQVIAKAAAIICGSMATLKSENFWLDTSQTIAVLRPTKSDDQDAFVHVSPFFRKTVPTTYTWLLLSRAAAEIEWDRVKNFFRMIRSGGETATLQGYVWENYCRERLSNSPDECVLCEPLLPANGAPVQTNLQNFSFTLGTGHIPFVDAENLATVLNNMNSSEIQGKLFVPVQRNFPTLDFLFFDFIPGDTASGRKDTLQANLLQTSISNSHSDINSVGIVLVAYAIPPRLLNLAKYPPRLIILVPEPKAFRKTSQALEVRGLKTGKEFSLVAAASSWLKKVPQYVAACPHWAAAWGRTRTEAEIVRTDRLIAETYQQKTKEVEADLKASRKRNAELEKEIRGRRMQIRAQEALQQENNRLKDELDALKKSQAKIERTTLKRSRDEKDNDPGTSAGTGTAGQVRPSKLARKNSQGRKERRP